MAAVTRIWSGGVRDTTAQVAAKIDTAAASCRLVVATDSALTSPVYSASVVAGSDGWVQLSVSGLTANTGYYYGVEIGGVLDATRGQFTTLPTPGSAASFTFAVGSCQVTNSAHKVFTAIKDKNPRFFAQIGDLHYLNIATNDPTLFVAAYEGVLNSATFGPLAKALPIAYGWDDHDCAGNNCNRTSTAIPAAAAGFRECVPSGPLAATDGQGIYRAWQVGRAWFIMTDLRSYRDPNGNTDNASKTMMGTTQKAWFKAQLDAAKAAGAQAIFWFSSSVWNSKPPYAGLDATDNDHWGVFSYERAELVDYMKANTIPQVIVLTGDMHAMAHDGSGRISDFATGGGYPTPVFVNSALDQSANWRGTGWTQGPLDGGGHYGLVTVTDDGSTFRWSWEGHAVDAVTGRDTVAMSYNGFIPAPTKTWDGSAWTQHPAKAWDGSAWTQRQPAVH